MPYIVCNDVNLYYETSGTGPSVVLLHGNSIDLHFFDNLTDQLVDTYTVYRVDSRCHGKSEKTPAIDYDLMTEDVAALIENLSLERPGLIGSSDGGI